MTKQRLILVLITGGILYIILFFVQNKILRDYKKEALTEKIEIGPVSKNLYEHGILPSDFPYINWDRGYMVYSTTIFYVYDGDTVRDREGRIIRFLGINAPEIPHPELGKPKGEKGGKEAMDYVKKRILKKSVLLFVPEDETRGYYGRILALIFYKDKGKWHCINWDMVKQGFAQPYIFKTNGFLKEEMWYSVYNEK